MFPDVGGVVSVGEITVNFRLNPAENLRAVNRVQRSLAPPDTDEPDADHIPSRTLAILLLQQRGI
jgi:hypothetical protein